MNVISFSVYGNDPLYIEGIKENVLLAPKIYPGWQVHIYTDQNITTTKDYVTILPRKQSDGHSGMFWRFESAINRMGYTIFRDADSRLNVREAAAVKEWIRENKASPRPYHVMRDHPDHADWPMLGGMWGINGISALPPFPDKMTDKLDDMIWLADKVWPIAKNYMVHHSSVDTKHPDARPFPDHEPYEGYVGEIIHVGTRSAG